MEFDVSIIYVNFHTSHLIVDSIKSVIENVKNINYEIIIVDNNSEPNLQEYFSSFISSSLNINYIFLDENIGFGRANNIGAKHARGEFLFLLNPDTILLNNAIKILFDFIKNSPRIGACGGNLKDKNNNPAFSFRKIFPGPNWEFQELTHNFFSYPINHRKRFFNFTNKPIPVAYISGADLMIKTDVFKGCKGFPEDLFMYWEDVEICKRIKDLGYEIYSVPQAEIMHLESQSFDNINLKKTLKIELQEKYRHVYLNNNLSSYHKFWSNVFYRLFLESRILTVMNCPKRKFYQTRKEYYLKYKE